MLCSYEIPLFPGQGMDSNMCYNSQAVGVKKVLQKGSIISNKVTHIWRLFAARMMDMRA